MSSCVLVVLLSVAEKAVAVTVDPSYAENITIYHVNPHQYGAIPINMVSNVSSSEQRSGIFNVSSRSIYISLSLSYSL